MTLRYEEKRLEGKQKTPTVVIALDPTKLTCKSGSFFCQSRPPLSANMTFFSINVN